MLDFEILIDYVFHLVNVLLVEIKKINFPFVWDMRVCLWRAFWISCGFMECIS